MTFEMRNNYFHLVQAFCVRPIFQAWPRPQPWPRWYSFDLGLMHLSLLTGVRKGEFSDVYISWQTCRIGQLLLTRQKLLQR